MNELIFSAHILINLIFLLTALRLGKNALCIFFVLQAFLANFFILEQISLFGLKTTASDAYVVAAVLALNLIQEYFGKQEAKKTVFLAFFALAVFAAVSRLQLWYAPTSGDYALPAYTVILKIMPRLAVSSVASFAVSQKIDMEFFGYLKKKLVKKFFLRMSAAGLVSQTADTFIFSFLALYGNVEKIFHVIVLSLMLKYCLLVFSSSILTFFKKFSFLEKKYEI